MNIQIENVILAAAGLTTLLLLVFAVDWRYFRDWVVVFLFKAVFDLTLGSAVVERGLLEYPVRLLPGFFDTSIIFEIWIFPTLCVLYNQVVRNRGIWPSVYYAFLFSAGITALEYPAELYTGLVRYIKWSLWTSLFSLTGAFILSRLFIAFYRWGCVYFGRLDET